MFNRILNRYNQLFALWVVLGGMVAYFYPGAILPFKPYMTWFFALTMLGVGMVTELTDFVAIFKNFKQVVVGVVAQYSIMPILSFCIAMAFFLDKEFALGLILAGSAPGAMASNVLCYLARANVAYSVSLTTVSTLLSPLLTPLLTLLLASTILDIPFWNMFKSVCYMVLFPLSAGLCLRFWLGRHIQPIARVFPAISTTFITFICALVIAMNKGYLQSLQSNVLLAVVLLNGFGLFAGYYTGRIFKFNRITRRALAIEVGMQNAGLGSVLALKHFNERVALPAVLFVFVCIFSASFLVQIWSKDTS